MVLLNLCSILVGWKGGCRVPSRDQISVLWKHSTWGLRTLFTSWAAQMCGLFYKLTLVRGEENCQTVLAAVLELDHCPQRHRGLILFKVKFVTRNGERGRTCFCVCIINLCARTRCSQRTKGYIHRGVTCFITKSCSYPSSCDWSWLQWTLLAGSALERFCFNKKLNVLLSLFRLSWVRCVSAFTVRSSWVMNLRIT